MSQFRLGFSASDVIKNDTKIWGNLDTIKKWLVQEPIPKLLDEQILIFLTAAGHDVQTAKNIIKSHYHLKQTRPEIFDGRTLDEKMRRNLKAVLTANLPVYHNDSIIFFWKMVEKNVDDYDHRCMASLLTMNVDASVFNGPVKSAIFLLDGNGMTFKHLMKMKLDLLRTISEYIQSGFPMRLAGIHLINSSSTVKALFKMLSPFIKPEMAGLIHFHRSGMDMELFHEEWIPKRCLPREYGGELESIEIYHHALVEQLESLQWFFDAELSQRSQM
uniref:CRAL-TRIO domain-containing protein n=1 Tax=Photinus pyralis TaxID=7054 RepID=A0A1Y1N9D0_PHOPY